MGDLGTLLAIWAAVYGATVALYFVQGWLCDRINARHPDRRIQPDRRGEERKRVDIIQSLKSLIVTSGCLAGGLWLQWKGWTIWAPLELTWLSGVLMLILSIVLYDAWFYWAHRLMHWRPLYKYHFWHHRAVAPTVWTNYSDGLVDAFSQQSYYLFAPIFLPIPGAVLVLHRLIDHINGQLGHSGFEYFADGKTRSPSPLVCVTFHDIHHEKFDYNYANFFSIWDRLCGTLHPDYDARVKAWTPEKPET